MKTRFFVPGRIEVLGKHTDYAGGRSLLAAVDRGFTVTSQVRHDGQVNVVDAARMVTWETTLGPELAALDPADHPRDSGMGHYAFTVLRRFARNFPDARRGAVMTIESSLPEASGMSSSSALMIGIFLALAEANDLRSHPSAASIFRTPEALAGYLAAVENGEAFEQHTGDRGVGTSGGSEDHTAILCCGEGSLSQYAFCPVRHERTVALDPELTFAIAVSGVTAVKTGAARERYNNAVESVREIMRTWREATGRQDRVLADALSSGPDATDTLRQVLAAAGRDHLLPRLGQFVEESTVIVPAAASSLAEGNIRLFGDLVDRSQALAEEALGNQVPETIWLASSARRLGAVAASAFGAGFGGSVWALVAADAARPFVDAWRELYHEAFRSAHGASAFFLTRPGAAAHRIE